MSCILLGVAKITAAESLRDENGGGDAQQLGAALKALRDALIRRIGVDRLSHRYGELKKVPSIRPQRLYPQRTHSQDQQFLSASAMFHKTNPQDWDTHLVQCLDTAYEAIQNSVLQDVMVCFTGASKAKLRTLLTTGRAGRDTHKRLSRTRRPGG